MIEEFLIQLINLNHINEVLKSGGVLSEADKEELFNIETKLGEAYAFFQKQTSFQRAYRKMKIDAVCTEIKHFHEIHNTGIVGFLN